MRAGALDASGARLAADRHVPECLARRAGRALHCFVVAGDDIVRGAALTDYCWCRRPAARSAHDDNADHARCRRRRALADLTEARGVLRPPRGITTRTFVDAERSNHVGLVVDVADMDTLQQALATPEAADAMKHDGVHPDTVHIMTAS